ncbi:hypothetical protein HK405_001148, partial [Cladochytrium tenue]
ATTGHTSPAAPGSFYLAFPYGRRFFDTLAEFESRKRQFSGTPYIEQGVVAPDGTLRSVPDFDRASWYCRCSSGRPATILRGRAALAGHSLLHHTNSGFECGVVFGDGDFVPVPGLLGGGGGDDDRIRGSSGSGAGSGGSGKGTAEVDELLLPWGTFSL